jgi:transposase
MPKRKYVQIKQVEDQIQLMQAEGMTNREIADHFGLNLKQVKNWVNRHNRLQNNLAIGITPKPKGRPRKDGLSPRQNEKKEIERLRMENKLLRDFLQFTGRK